MVVFIIVMLVASIYQITSVDMTLTILGRRSNFAAAAAAKPPSHLRVEDGMALNSDLLSDLETIYRLMIL